MLQTAKMISETQLAKRSTMDGPKILRKTDDLINVNQTNSFAVQLRHLHKQRQKFQRMIPEEISPIGQLRLEYLKLKLNYDRQSIGQFVLVSGTHLGPATNFSFSLKFLLDSCGFVIL
jgi:hypothetical protein